MNCFKVLNEYQDVIMAPFQIYQSLKGQSGNKNFWQDIPLKIGKLLDENQVVENVEEADLSQLNNPLPYRKVVSKPIWSESVTSIKSLDPRFVYKASSDTLVFDIKSS